MKIAPLVGKSSTKTSAPKGQVKNTHRVRVGMEKLGIALIGAGTYVFDRIDLTGHQDLPIKAPKGASEAVCILEGDKGVLARVGRTDGSRFWLKDGGVIAASMFPTGKLRFLAPEKFRKEIQSKGHRAEISFRSKSGSKKVSGFGYVNPKAIYGFICPTGIGARLGDPVDFELKANKHNAGKVARIISVT